MKKYVLPILVIFLVVAASLYKTLWFYFWHDDFSWFYLIRNNSCFSFWPYNTFCSFLSFLYHFLGYNPFLYHLLGIILLFFVSVMFFLFCRRFFDILTSTFLSAVFSTVFIGSGAFVEAHSSILVLMPFLLLLISLLLFSYSVYKDKFKFLPLLIGIFIFMLSVLIAPIRSSTHVFPAVAFVFIFLNKVSLKKRAMLGAIIAVAYYLSFFVFPLDSERKFIDLAENAPLISSFNIFRKIDYFLKTFGSFFLTDEIQNSFFSKVPLSRVDLVRQILAGVAIFFVVFLLIKKKVKGVFLRITIFVFVWIIAFYIPYGIHSNWRIPSNHRYLLTIFPGLVLFLGVFHRYKFWKLFIVVIVLSGIIQTNLFFGQHITQSKARYNFYLQMHEGLKSLPKDSVLFFDSSQRVRNDMTDFFRVGYFPSEASLGTEYGVDYKGLKLILDSKSFKNYLERHVDTGRLFTFYYDGVKVYNTSEVSWKLLASSSESNRFYINNRQNTQYQFDKKNGQWTGVMEDVSFEIPGLNPLVPSTVSLDIAARFPIVPLPYTQGCVNCVYDPVLTKKSFEYLIAAKKLKRVMKVEVSNSAEETRAIDLIDNNFETYWLADRQAWFRGTKSVVSLIFGGGEKLGGVVLSSNFPQRQPSGFRLLVNGEDIGYTEKKVGQDKTILMMKDPGVIQKLDIELISTVGGDAPGIMEIDPVPFGFPDINVDYLYKVASFPSSIIKNDSDVGALAKYLSTGVQACLKWRVSGYGEGKEDIHLFFVDGKMHTYDVNLPAMGMEKAIFSLGCFDYPVNLNLVSGRFKYNK